MQTLLWLSIFSGFVLGQSNFESCLAIAQNITVITASDESYSSASQPFNLRLTPTPVAIVYPNTPEQISHIVTCGASSGMNISTRSGGHSYAAYGLAGNIVIDLRKLKNLTVDTTGKAVSQTGLLLGELAEGLWNQAQRALPHGSCPYVGTGGHALYGGFGYYGRVAGLLLDRIVSADVVLANGTAVIASNASNTDLFWALRGAGPSFGIVTSWTFDTLPAPAMTVYYQITFASDLLADEVTSTFSIWQQFATTAPNELAMSAVLGPTGQGGISLSFQGSYYGTLAQFNSAVASLLPNLPSNRRINATELSWLDGLASLASQGALNTSRPEPSNTFFAKSLITTQPSPTESIASWVKYLFGPGLSTTISWFAEIDLYGGAIAAVPADATAFAHRNAFLVYQLYASTSSRRPPYPDDGVSFVNNMLMALEAYPQAAYPNYIDPTLSMDQWQSLYFADHITRLEQIKRDVDPSNVFNFQQAIPPAPSSTSTSGAEASRKASANAASSLSQSETILFTLALVFGSICTFYVDVTI